MIKDSLQSMSLIISEVDSISANKTAKQELAQQAFGLKSKSKSRVNVPKINITSCSYESNPSVTAPVTFKAYENNNKKDTAKEMLATEQQMQIFDYQGGGSSI